MGVWVDANTEVLAYLQMQGSMLKLLDVMDESVPQGLKPLFIHFCLMPGMNPRHTFLVLFWGWLVVSLGLQQQIPFGNDNKKIKCKSGSFTSPPHGRRPVRGDPGSFRMTTFVAKRIPFGNDNKKSKGKDKSNMEALREGVRGLVEARAEASAYLQTQGKMLGFLDVMGERVPQGLKPLFIQFA
jgi:hypothetical protein